MMPTRRLPDPPGWKNQQQLCLSPSHNPPTHMVYEPGTWEHICPECGHRTVFVVNGIFFTGGQLVER